MNKIKEILSNIWAVVVLVLGSAIGILIYILKAKQKKINALKARIDLVETQKQADLLEVEIKQSLTNTSLLQKEITELNNSLLILEDKRKQIAAEQSGKTPQEAEDYWNKK